MDPMFRTGLSPLSRVVVACIPWGVLDGSRNDPTRKAGDGHILSGTGTRAGGATLWGSEQQMLPVEGGGSRSGHRLDTPAPTGGGVRVHLDDLDAGRRGACPHTTRPRLGNHAALPGPAARRFQCRHPGPGSRVQ
jgi:hypothetical protein